MAEQGISFSREHEMPVFYKGQQVGSRRVDFLVEGAVSVELKAIIQLEDVQLAQAINYLEAYDLEVGLLINFGARSLEFKRVTCRRASVADPLRNQDNPVHPTNQFRPLVGVSGFEPPTSTSRTWRASRG